jgi:hypothetical protein
MSKTAILPIISVICLAYATITGHTVSNDLQDDIASITTTIIAAVISIWGVVKNHKKDANK